MAAKLKVLFLTAAAFALLALAVVKVFGGEPCPSDLGL